ncbi:mycothione reductase [Pseudonocardia saturnea]
MRQHDLIVIGAGSGNMIIGSFPDLDVAVVEQGPFGGTCLNVGCIPTKMLAHTADIAEAVRGAAAFGLDAHLGGLDWPSVRDRVFGRLDAISADGRAGRVDDPGVTVYSGHARFSGVRTLQVERADGSGTDTVGADRIVIAAGGRPVVPEPVRSSGVPFETSDTIMRIPALPRRLAILGGGYIAAEFAHVFSALGCEITMIDMADRLLAGQDETVSERFTELARKRFDVRLGRELAAARHGTDAHGTDGLRLDLDDGSHVDADLLLVAVGRVPNGDRMDLSATGVEQHEDGRIVVDAHQRTTADGVYALGDVSTSVPLKHVANREAEVVTHNLLHPDELIETDLDVVPAAIFTDPQIAAVGRTGQDCRDDGVDHVVSTTPYSDSAYGWAMEDPAGFCKIIAERGTGRLLGAHIMGPQAATLIQPLVLAMSCGIDAETIARRPFWIHPALTEVVENTLLGLLD